MIVAATEHGVCSVRFGDVLSRLQNDREAKSRRKGFPLLPFRRV